MYLGKGIGKQVYSIFLEGPCFLKQRLFLCIGCSSSLWELSIVIPFTLCSGSNEQPNRLAYHNIRGPRPLCLGNSVFDLPHAFMSFRNSGINRFKILFSHLPLVIWGKILILSEAPSPYLLTVARYFSAVIEPIFNSSSSVFDMLCPSCHEQR